MSCFAYTNKNGKRCVCSCMNSECSVECNLYRKYNGIKTHYDLLVSMTPNEMALWFAKTFGDEGDYNLWMKFLCAKCAPTIIPAEEGEK